MFVRGALQARSFEVIAAQSGESSVQRRAATGIKEPCGSAPQFPERRNVRQHERATGGGGFQDGEPKRLIERRTYEDPSVLEMCAQGTVRQLSKPGDTRRGVGAGGACDLNRPIQSPCRLRQNSDILGAIPEPAGREDQLPLSTWE